jgi:AcrR family transcriptional regulator
MSQPNGNKGENNIRQRLLDAGLKCFLEEDYRNVSMRKVALLANANMSMIYYYFINKEHFFEEVLRSWLQPMIDNIQPQNKAVIPQSFEEFFHMYYRSALVHPQFPLLILNTLNSSEAPGGKFLCETVLERGRKSGIQWANSLKAGGKIAQDIDPELLRIAVVSLSMMPMLMRDFLAQQLDEPIDEAFFTRLSTFYERILSHGIVNNDEDK